MHNTFKKAESFYEWVKGLEKAVEYKFISKEQMESFIQSKADFKHA